jgi:hypothetical protein
MIHTFVNFKNHKLQCNNKPTKSIKSNNDIKIIHYFVQNMCLYIL